MSEPDPTNAAVFYRWKDAQGLEHVVDSLDKVPEAARARSERVALVAPARRETTGIVNVGGVRVDWPSFAGGFGVALVLAFAFGVARQARRPVVEFVVVVAGAVLIGAIFYFGWVKQKVEPTTPERDFRSILYETGKIGSDKAKPPGK